MKKTTLLKSMFLLCALVVGSGSVWADSYTITFSNSASSATLISTSTYASTTVALASRSYVATKPFTDISGNCYYGGSSTAEKTSIRVGKAGNSASLTISLSEEGRVKATSIVVNCFKFNDSNKGTIAVNGMAAQSVPTSSAGDLTFTYAVPTNITTIVLSTTKATFLYSITVNYVIETGEETAVDIDDSGITNTDIFTSTIGGKLKATVYDKSVEAIVGAVVSWESDNKAVAKVGSDGSVTLVGAGTATITASYAGQTGVYKSSSETYDLTVTDSNPNPNDGSAAKPYTIAEAIAAYNVKGSDVDGKYITGIVKGFYNDNSTPNGSGQLSYWISADGSGNDFEIYKGKAIGDANFTTSPEDNRVAIGDRVVVYGTITYYSGGSVYELKENNVLISKTALTLAKEVGADGWATYIAEGDYEFEPENAFVVASAGTSVSLTPVTKVPSGTPLILKGEGKKWVTALAETPAAPTNSLRVSNGAGEGTTNDYVLGRKNGVAGFYKWNGGELSANKVYLPADVVTTAHEFLGFDIDVNNDVTTINEIKGKKAEANGVYYNLAGQRVQKPTKGLYIVNGKKVIIK